MLTPEEKFRIAEAKRKEEEAIILATVLDKNIYKKHDETIQGMLGKLASRLGEESTKYVKAKWTSLWAKKK